MRRTQVPVTKIGTPYQRPSWRLDAISRPSKYGFRWLCTRQKDDAGAYKRLINKGLDYTVTYKYPKFFTTIAKNFPSHLKKQLELIWDRKYKKENSHKIVFNGVASMEDFVSWNAARVDNLHDVWFKKIIKHVFGLEYYSEIAYALELSLLPEYGEQKKYIGYQIFAGIPDTELAKTWNIPVKNICAVRHMLYDFSYMPKDKVARWAMLRQLVENEEIEKDDFSLYKRVFDMGELGLKAQVCYAHLTAEERDTVADYLGKSAMQNTFQLNFAVRTSKDALVYNRVISDMAKLQLQREELKVKQAELKLMELQAIKMRSEVNVTADETQPEDLQLLQGYINELSRKDSEHKFPSVVDVTSIK